MDSEEAAFSFTILPPWYRTGWAYLIYVLLGLGLLYGGARAWGWRLEQKNRRLEAVIAERTEALRQTNQENERLLLNILPEPIAERLKHSDEPIADAFADVTVLFADLVGFTTLSQHTSAAGLVALLNDLFSDFDALALEHGVEKIKTIGDAYMAVCGLPEERPDHAEAMATMALDMIDALDRFNAAHGTLLDMRVGINTGPVVAGVIGTHKFIYDLWGDTVNTAARMESHGVPGRVHVTAATYERLKTVFVLEARGAIEIKGKHLMHTYLLRGRRPLPGLQAATSQPSVLSSETPS
jgi:class 3 adenylate cyclase